MTTATEVIGPMVRMCDNPRCGSEGGPVGCSQAGPGSLMGMSVQLDPSRDDESVCARLSMELSLQYATDSHMVRRMIPDGCEFTAHRAPPQVDFETKARGYVAWMAFCARMEQDRDEVLAGSPEWDWDAVHERYKRMQAMRATRGLPPA